MSSSDAETESDELDPDEPRTPLWLPLLGGGLFLLALLLFLATRSDDDADSDNAGGADQAEQAEQAQPAGAEDQKAGDTEEDPGQ